MRGKQLVCCFGTPARESVVFEQETISQEVEHDLSKVINENLHNLYVRLVLLGLLSKGT
jgi:hypothetical protein